MPLRRFVSKTEQRNPKIAFAVALPRRSWRAKSSVTSSLYLLYSRGTAIAFSMIYMRLLKDLLTYVGAACTGLALGGYVAASLPLYGVNNIVTVGRCNFVLSIGFTSVVMAYGFHRRAVFAWWLGCLAYIILVGYFFCRAVTTFEIPSYIIMLILIGEGPFVGLWWRYAKLYFPNDKDR